MATFRHLLTRLKPRPARVISVERPRWTTLAGRMTARERRAALRAVAERMGGIERPGGDA